MALTVSTIAPSRRLTRKETVKLELGITASTDDALIEALIDAASAAIEGYTGWRYGFARQVYSETVKGYGGLELALTQCPLVSVTSVTYDGTDVITDYSIGDRDESVLYRETGWWWTVQSAAGLTGRQRWPGFGAPQPQTEQPDYTIVYTAGYILPPSNRLSVATISAAAADDSFNDSASGFPALLKAGDVIETSGFTAAADNGRFLVTGTPTTAKIVVDAALTDENAAAGRTMLFRGRPDHLPYEGLEKAAIETTKTWYLTRKDDSDIVEKAVGPMRLRRSEDRTGLVELPPLAAALVRPWMKRGEV